MNTRLLAAALALAPAALLMSSAGAAAQDARADHLRAAPEVASGISLELARERAATLSDITYDVAIQIPAEVTSPVTGEVTVGFHRSGDGPLVLDFADPSRIRSVSVDGSPADYREVTTHILVPDSALPDGQAEVTLVFEAGDGPLNRREDFLYTLFVPDRAHEVLPVFDQPDLKARFRLRLTVPREWTAVANGGVERREAAGDDLVYEFSETRPLPTYLFAFAAGRFDVESAERNGRELRLIHRETDREKVERNLEAIFDLHADALAWLEEYTGIDYPFGPFDVVAIPSFQYNGMEHPGSILYRASTLFLDESATRSEELSRASVIAHETAHMWFGDLVTMRWFSDVWMKEVFANFMAAKIVHPSFPELDHELRFLLSHYPSAYGVDRTPGANAIRQPLDNLSDAGSLYGAIIYQKAPIVMRQLELLVGDDVFRKALRRYLNAHPYGNASWPELVRELDALADLDVSAWSRVWIEEPGRPVIDVERGANEVVLHPRDPAERGRVWPQRTTVAIGEGEQAVTLAGAPVTVPLPRQTEGGEDVDGAVPVIPNADGLGYGLFRLDPASRDTLLETLPALEQPLTRAVAWLDLWEMMLEGEVGPEAMLDLAVRTVAVEEDELLAEHVLGDLTELFWRYVTPAERARMVDRLEQTLWDRTTAVEGASRKAAYFNAWRSVATGPEAIRTMEEVWSGELEIEGLPLSERDRTSLAFQLAIRDTAIAEAVLDRQRERIDNPDRQERFDFIRPAVSPDPEVRERFFESLAEAENRSREEWVASALGLLHHPLRAGQSLRYVRPALELLEEVRDSGDIFFPTRWLAATFRGHASPEAAAIVRAFIDENPDYPHRLMEKLLQEADPLFRAAMLRSG